MTVRVIVDIEIDDKKGKEIEPLIGKTWQEKTYAENSAINRFCNEVTTELLYISDIGSKCSLKEVSIKKEGDYLPLIQR